MVALAALAVCCSRVYISDFSAEKLKIAGQYDGIMPVNLNVHGYADVIFSETANWGADVVFEASGSAKTYDGIFNLVHLGGTIVLVGLPVDRVTFEVPFACSREVRIETVVRYANIFDRALNLIASGKVNLKPLITGFFAFEDSIKAFERAASALPTDVKLQIRMSDTIG
jgi:D-xylulose reductase